MRCCLSGQTPASQRSGKSDRWPWAPRPWERRRHCELSKHDSPPPHPHPPIMVLAPRRGVRLCHAPGAPLRKISANLGQQRRRLHVLLSERGANPPPPTPNPPPHTHTLTPTAATSVTQSTHSCNQNSPAAIETRGLCLQQHLEVSFFFFFPVQLCSLFLR